MASVDNDNNYEDMKCDNCDRFLSCSPVFVKEDGKSICGDCNEGKEHLTFRNKTYEAVAKRLKFPCCFINSGCDEIHLWEENKHHEDECIYRRYNCFVNYCTWIGSQFNMKQHYEEKHPQFILNLPAKVQPNITVNNDVKYLTSLFDNIFILHVKYTVSNSALSYYTCFLGKSNFASCFDFALEITAEHGNINLKKSVQPINELYSPKNTNVIELNLNSLLSLGMITKYEDCTINFLIEMKTILCSDCKSKLTALYFLDKNCYCNACFHKIKQKLNSATNSNIKCKRKTNVSNKHNLDKCAPNNTTIKDGLADTAMCKYCDYQDNRAYLPKHTNWLCAERSSLCSSCSEYVKIPLIVHYIEEHIPQGWKFNTNTLLFKNMNTDIYNEAAFYAYGAIFFIRFNFKNSLNHFRCTILSDLPKSKLDCFKCTFKFCNPTSNEKMMDMYLTNKDWDWEYSGNHSKLNSLYNVKINITKF